MRDHARPTVLYDDSDPGACAWLRELVSAGHLAAGEVLERDVRELRGADLATCQRTPYGSAVPNEPMALG